MRGRRSEDATAVRAHQCIHVPMIGCSQRIGSGQQRVGDDAGGPRRATVRRLRQGREPEVLIGKKPQRHGGIDRRRS